MRQFLGIYTSRAALIFSLAVIFTVLINLLRGNTQGNYVFLLELLGFVVVLEIIDYFISKLRFPSRFIYIASEFTIMYVSFLIFSYWGHWFSFHVEHLIFFTFVFLALFSLVHFYYHITLNHEAAAINRKLMKKNERRN